MRCSVFTSSSIQFLSCVCSVSAHLSNSASNVIRPINRQFTLGTQMAGACANRATRTHEFEINFVYLTPYNFCYANNWSAGDAFSIPSKYIPYFSCEWHVLRIDLERILSGNLLDHSPFCKNLNMNEQIDQFFFRNLVNFVCLGHNKYRAISWLTDMQTNLNFGWKRNAK